LIEQLQVIIPTRAVCLIKLEKYYFLSIFQGIKGQIFFFKEKALKLTNEIEIFEFYTFIKYLASTRGDDTITRHNNWLEWLYNKTIFSSPARWDLDRNHLNIKFSFVFGNQDHHIDTS
jgi:hypothetical protein